MPEVVATDKHSSLSCSSIEVVALVGANMGHCVGFDMDLTSAEEQKLECFMTIYKYYENLVKLLGRQVMLLLYHYSALSI